MLKSSEWFSLNQIECCTTLAYQDNYPKHSHQEYILSANLSGVERIWLNGKTSFVQSGQVTCYNPESIQSSTFAEQPTRFISIHIPQHALIDVIRENHLSSSHSAPVLTEGVLHHPELFQYIQSFTQQHSTEQTQQAFLLLCASLFQSPQFADHQTSHAIRLLQDDMRTELTRKISLDELSQISGLSKYYLIRSFKKFVGIPPLQYHMQLRIHRARDLLRQHVHSLDAATALGFYDQSHFIQSFKKIMGITPHDYAQQLHLSRKKFSIPRNHYVH